MLQQPVSSPAQRVGDATRRGELDLLRALVVVGLVFLRTAVIFGAGEFPLLVGLLTLILLQVSLGLRHAETSSYVFFYTHFWDVRPSLGFPFVITAAPQPARLLQNFHAQLRGSIVGHMARLPSFRRRGRW
jgi:hypothetical protein